YFRQYLNVDGWQQERYPVNDFHNLPLELQRGASGSPLIVEVELPGRRVMAQIWKVQVGRTPLYLLDTNLPDNATADQAITAQLYGGDAETRIQQEIILGIGGVRALHALGIKPSVCHLNEGHSAFLSLERIRRFMEDHGLDFRSAQAAAAGGNLF